MGFFVKRPVQVEAVQLTGDTSRDMDVYRWVEAHVGSTKTTMDYAETEPIPSKGVSIDPATGFLEIFTLEGVMQAKPGDWVIRGTQGEFYPCKDAIFREIYLPAGDVATVGF